MVGWIEDLPFNVAPDLYADTDLAGCERTQRSTWGGHLAIQDPVSKLSLAGKSTRQSATCSSSLEARIEAGHMVYNHMFIPALHLWELISEACLNGRAAK